MKKQEAILVSAQSPFSIDNFNNNENLTLSPPVYGAIYQGGDVTYERIYSWGAGSFGRILSTVVYLNEYGLKIGYIAAPISLNMKGSSIECEFKIEKHGNHVSYIPQSPAGKVLAFTILYDDLIGGAALIVGNPSQKARNEKKADPEMVDDVYSINADGITSQNSATSKGSNFKIIPDNEPFSILTNASLYFTKPIYQKINDVWTEKNERLSREFGSFGGFYCFTGDESSLYPDGISTLTIKDGFSEGEATIEFDHNTTDKTVTIRIISHSSRVCDIRDLSEVGYGFPNTICFAL